MKPDHRSDIPAPLLCSVGSREVTDLVHTQEEEITQGCESQEAEVIEAIQEDGRHRV